MIDRKLETSTEANADRNKARVREFSEINGAGNLDLLDDLLHDDFVRVCPATPQVAVRSRDEFKQFLVQDAVTFPDSRVEHDLLVAEGNRVAFYGRFEATQTGPLGPHPPSGRKVALDVSGVFTFRDAKIAELRIVWDNVSLFEQLGLSDPPG